MKKSDYILYKRALKQEPAFMEFHILQHLASTRLERLLPSDRILHDPTRRWKESSEVLVRNDRTSASHRNIYREQPKKETLFQSVVVLW